MNLTSFSNKVIHLVDEGKAVDVVYPDISNVFYTISHCILLEDFSSWRNWLLMSW